MALTHLLYLHGFRSSPQKVMSFSTGVRWLPATQGRTTGCWKGVTMRFRIFLSYFRR